MTARHGYDEGARGGFPPALDEDDDDPTRMLDRSMLPLGAPMQIDDDVELTELEGAPTRMWDAKLPIADGAPGWGPRVRPPELAKTTFWERSVLVADDADDAVEPAPSTPPPRAKAAEPITSSELRRPRSRGLVYAGLCGALGVAIGTAVGLTANLDPEAPPATVVPTATASVPVAPEAPAASAAAPAAVAPAAVVQAVEAAPEEAAPEEAASVAEDAAPAEPAPPPETPEELLEQATDALRDVDLPAAEELIGRAREAGAAARDADRLDAQLAVLRGEGAPAVPRLRSMAERRRDPAVWVALGRALEQAERDPEASQAFESALHLDPQSVDAHLGLASIAVRGANIAAAQRHLRIAEEAARAAPDRDPLRDARLRVVSGQIHLERGRFSEATEEATRARVLDPRSAEAALLLGRIALARRQDALPHLRAAVEGRAPAPLALGLLAPRVRGEESCQLAGRYLDRAPEGWDARAMRRILSRCL